tara:strand:+ start:443 stop:889 length:447 start_codon:yes stop_codon:yes gene_type:complete
MQKGGEQRPVDPRLFDWPSESPALKCSLCSECGARAFPVNKTCMACGSENVVESQLPVKGRLWTYTVQSFMPKTPYRSDETSETFRPFAIGYVELENTLRIETRIPVSEGRPLRIGMEMALDFYTHRIADDGTEIVSYQFRPAEGDFQ